MPTTIETSTGVSTETTDLHSTIIDTTVNTPTKGSDTTTGSAGFCPDANCTIGPPCDDGSTWPHVTDCSMYWRCSTHVCLCLLECEEGFFFDPKRDKCRPEQEVDCDVVSVLRLADIALLITSKNYISGYKSLNRHHIIYETNRVRST